ncbi:hypothetical protein I552_8299 [Mycobacterium xenopi 3993]|nr:hypothetical protein I552_8299 [Mycobacterium xenopi 3993]
MADLVGDGPARRGCRVRPTLGRQRRHQRIQFVAFGAQVVNDRAAPAMQLP